MYYSLINSMNKASVSGGAIITSGLMLNLDAGNPSSYPGTGTTWTDLSGNGRDSTLYNGVSYSSANNGSLVFDGTNDYASQSNFIGTLNTFTSGTWIKLNANQVAKTFFSNYINGSGWVIGIADSNTNVVKFYLGGGTLLATSALSINVWYYVCATYNNGNPTIYINGVLNSTTSALINLVSTSDVVIGALDVFSRQPFNGNIANTHFYNRALSSTEILNNFNTLKSRYGY